MSYFGSWPVYKISNFRGAGELIWKLARLSWRIDRIGVPLMIPPLVLMYYFREMLPMQPYVLENPYTEAYKQKKEEGKYNGSVIGLRPEKYI